MASSAKKRLAASRRKKTVHPPPIVSKTIKEEKEEDVEEQHTHKSESRFGSLLRRTDVRVSLFFLLVNVTWYFYVRRQVERDRKSFIEQIDKRCTCHHIAIGNKTKTGGNISSSRSSNSLPKRKTRDCDCGT